MKEVKNMAFREIKLGYATVSEGQEKVDIPSQAKVIGVERVNTQIGHYYKLIFYCEKNESFTEHTKCDSSAETVKTEEEP